MTKYTKFDFAMAADFRVILVTTSQLQTTVVEKAKPLRAPYNFKSEGVNL